MKKERNLLSGWAYPICEGKLVGGLQLSFNKRKKDAVTAAIRFSEEKKQLMYMYL
jgi:hypothetical protein